MKKLYEIIYMKADFEPWWQFEGWEEYIVNKWEFETEEQYDKFLEDLLQSMRKKYPCERLKNDFYYAFWDEEELEYCEGCDEDAQVFHGIITKISSFV